MADVFSRQPKVSKVARKTFRKVGVMVKPTAGAIRQVARGIVGIGIGGVADRIDLAHNKGAKKRVSSRVASGEDTTPLPPKKKKRLSRQLSVAEAQLLLSQENIDSADAFRETHGIVVAGLPSGQAAPPPVRSFEALAELRPLLPVLAAKGYNKPTLVQAQTWPLVLQGHDVVAIAGTGSGKTCAFALPVLARLANRRLRSPERKPLATPSPAKGSPPPGSWTCALCANVNWPQRSTCNTRSCGAQRPKSDGVLAAAPSSKPHKGRPAKPSALILAPTRELAQQIYMEILCICQAIGVRAACIYGGVPKGKQAQNLVNVGADIVIATPGRCLDFLDDDRFFGVPLVLEGVSYLVLDEADRMLEAGFLPDIQKIASSCPAPRRKPMVSTDSSTKLRRQTLFFSATWPVSVQEAAGILVGASAVRVQVAQRQLGKPTVNKDISQLVEVLDAHGAKFPRLVEVLRNDLKQGTCLVFCKTKSRCDWLAKKISSMITCPWIRAIHSGKKQREREDVLSTFRLLTAKNNHETGVLVATNVAGRGLDIPGVQLVVVYDFGTVDDYVHQVGRTGRGGSGGRAVVFYVSGDGYAQEFVDVLRVAGQTVPSSLCDIASAAADVKSGKLEECRDDDRARQGVKRKQWKLRRTAQSA